MHYIWASTNDGFTMSQDIPKNSFWGIGIVERIRTSTLIPEFFEFIFRISKYMTVSWYGKDLGIPVGCEKLVRYTQNATVEEIKQYRKKRSKK